MTKMNKQIKSSDWLARGYSEEELAKIKEQAIKEAEAELRNKQIKEMAKDVCDALMFEWDADVGITEVDAMQTAEKLYNAGYRKQSEGEWVEEHREWDMPPFFYVDYTCSVCGQREQDKSPYCRWCGAKMKAEDTE